MIELGLLLLGGHLLRRYWYGLALIGLAWALVGAWIFVDALDGSPLFPIKTFGYLLLIESIAALAGSGNFADPHFSLRRWRGVAMLVLSLLIIDARPSSHMVLAVLLGLGFALDGGCRLVGAWVVHFEGWVWSLLVGVIEIVFAVFIFMPSILSVYEFVPSTIWTYHTVFPFCIGLGMMLSGVGLLRRGWQFHGLRPEVMLSEMLMQGRDEADCLMPLQSPPSSPCKLIVHVWTPSGSALEVVPAPLINRYIAAVDGAGVISTGHAALEFGTDVYVSHYPAVEIDRSSQDFRRALRATAENDVDGLFQPDYAQESAEWCESDVKIRFAHFSASRLYTFWRHYRVDTTYNLTKRNCSSSVARCLEASLEGVMCSGRFWVLDLLRTMINPELWLASQLRRRAESMAWTPGIMLDYARALNAAVQPAPLGWPTLFAALGRSGRYIWLVVRGRPIPNIQAMRRKSEADMRKLDTALTK
nr:DUF308 domain-containing protein [Dyella sp. ASV24]